MDDHEVINNAQDATAPPFRAAHAVWRHYLGLAASPTRSQALFGFYSPGAPQAGQIGGGAGDYYSFAAGGACFFVLDTRSQRGPARPQTGSTLLGEEQLARLKAALLEAQASEECLLQLVFSPVPVTPNYGDEWGNKEGWGRHVDYSELMAFLEEEKQVKAAVVAACCAVCCMLLLLAIVCMWLSIVAKH